MKAINHLLASLKLEANVRHNGQYCGDWAVDTSGTSRMTFHIVTKGQCFFKFEDEVITLYEGDAVFMPCDTQHCVTNTLEAQLPKNRQAARPMTNNLLDESTGLVCGNFAHANPIFGRLVQQMPKLIIVPHSHNGLTTKVIELILEESRTTAEHSSILLNRLADCLFYLLIRHHLQVEDGVFAAFSHQQLSAPMQLIHEHSHERLSLDDLARSAAMSRSAFSSVFKEVVGQSPMDYLTQWRMTLAYRWLADDNISTLDAAIRSGYDNEASFSKAFKRVMGVGPGKVRR